jgi:hypothetical protein
MSKSVLAAALAKREATTLATFGPPVERSRPYRKAAKFILEKDHCRPIDRNSRARILFLAERLERRTKASGRRNGSLGYVGIQILRVLLLTFVNSKSGICCPSYLALRCATGLSNAAVAKGLARLEAAGILEIARRLVRQRVVRVNQWTNMPEVVTTTTQATNLYRFNVPTPWAETLAPTPNARPFAPRRQIDLLAKILGIATESAREGENSLESNSKGQGWTFKAIG